MSHLKVPRPSSDLIIDPTTGHISREWFAFLEKLGVVASPIAALAEAQIFIGGTTGTPAAQDVTGDILIDKNGATTLQSTANVLSVIGTVSDLVKKSIATGVTKTVPTDFQLLVAGDFTINGTGELITVGTGEFVTI